MSIKGKKHLGCWFVLNRRRCCNSPEVVVRDSQLLLQVLCVAHVGQSLQVRQHGDGSVLLVHYHWLAFVVIYYDLRVVLKIYLKFMQFVTL